MASSTAYRVERLGEFFDAQVAIHDGKISLPDLQRRYGKRTLANVLAFAADILHVELTPQQISIVQLYLTERLGAVRSAVGIGKTHALGVIALYHVYCFGGMVLATSATWKQAIEQMFGSLRRLWIGAPELPGELFQSALRVNESTGQMILAVVSSGEDRLRGFHHERLLGLVDESHGCPPWIWDAVTAVATGEQNQILAVGNPGPPVGRWYEIHRREHWTCLRLSALDHPNVIAGREVVPGGIGRQYLEDVKQQHGEQSAFYVSTCLGEFAEEVGDQLIRREWVETAVARWHSGELEPIAQKGPWRAGLDVARFGADKCALAVRQGPVYRHLFTWGQCDTMQSIQTVQQLLHEQGISCWPFNIRSADDFEIRYYLRQASVIVDAGGLGAGPFDRMKEKGWKVGEFNGSHSPLAENAGRFLNRRAESYWAFRDQLEAGDVALPPDEELANELCAIKWHEAAHGGKIQLVSKDDLRVLLGHSPDKADAVVMAAEDPYRGVATIRPINVRWG